MNALKSYKKRKVDEKAREILFDGMDGFIEHVDLLILYVLYAEFGFGAKRLRRFFWAIKEHYEAFRDTFIQPGDETRYYVEEKRMDTFALKKYLLDIGFDYDAECAKKNVQNQGVCGAPEAVASESGRHRDGSSREH